MNVWLLLKTAARGMITYGSFISGEWKKHGEEEITVELESKNSSHSKVCYFSGIFECLLYHCCSHTFMKPDHGTLAFWTKTFQVEHAWQTGSALGECLTSSHLLILPLERAWAPFPECSCGHPAFELTNPPYAICHIGPDICLGCRKALPHRKAEFWGWLAWLGCIWLLLFVSQEHSAEFLTSIGTVSLSSLPQLDECLLWSHPSHFPPPWFSSYYQIFSPFP